MAKLIFFDRDHTYQVDGENIPSVSEVIRFMSREIYDGITQFTLDNAADRGTRVHKACENIDRFGSCEITADIEPYVRAYIQFRRDLEPDWQRIECAAYHEALRYAGTIDRYGTIGGKRMVVDLKTNSQIKTPLVTAQLNGYRLMAQANGMEVDGIAVLQLMKDGRYRYKEMEADDSTFLACLTLHEALKKKSRKRTDEK